MTDDSPPEMNEDELVDLLSAWLDDELDASARARVEEILASSPRAHDLLGSLTAGRDAVRAFGQSDESSPTQLEAARLDRAILGAPAARVSPSKRGRSPAPYFAVAAVIAVALMAGIVVLTRSISTPTADSVAGTADRGQEEAVGSPEIGGGEGSAADMSATGFFVSEITADGPEDLQMLLGTQASAYASDSIGEPTTTVSEFRPEEPLLRAAVGLEGFEDLPACLAAAETSVVPRRVDTGTWEGEAVYFVTGPDATGKPAVVVMARPGCTALLMVR